MNNVHITIVKEILLRTREEQFVYKPLTYMTDYTEKERIEDGNCFQLLQLTLHNIPHLIYCIQL